MFSNAKATSSSTTEETIWFSGLEKMYPTRGEISPGFRAWPPMRTCPEEEESRPLIILPKVLFPDPFGPITATYRPREIKRFSPAKTGRGGLFKEGYEKVASRNSIIRIIGSRGWDRISPKKKGKAAALPFVANPL